MRKLSKIGIGIGIVFLGLLSIGIVATILDSTPEPPKKVIEVKKPKRKVDKPKKLVAKRQVRLEYTAEEVYDFVCRYEIRSGQTVANIVDLAVVTLRSAGHSAEVIEGQAREYSTKGVWVVSCVVMVDSFERTQIRFEADMRDKTVKPLNKVARDLWGY